MVYFGLTSAMFLLRYALKGAQSARRQIYYIVLVGLFSFSAFRYQVGCDWSGYYAQFLLAGDVEWSFIFESREPIWWAILFWAHKYGFSYFAINIVSSAIFFVGVHVLARRQPDPLGFLVLLFPILIINMPMSGIRQGAAIGLSCIALVAFIDRRPVVFSFWVIIASGFHISALVFLLLVPLTIGGYNKRRLILAAFLAIPSVAILVNGEGGEVASSRYIGSDVEAFGAVFRLGILGLTALYFFFFLKSKWLRLFPKDYSIVSLGAIGMSFLFFLLPLSSVIADRFGYYLIPIQSIIISRLPLLSFKSNKAVHSALPYICLLLVFFVWTQFSRHFEICYIPYNNWLLGALLDLGSGPALVHK